MTVASSAGSAFGSLVQMKQSSAPDAVTETLNSAVTALGGSDLVLYLVDYEQTVLLPHPDTLPHGQHPEPASIEGTMAGKAFTTGSCQAAHRPDGWHVWVPVSERGNGLGVLALTLPNWDEEADRHCVDLGSAAAYMLVAAARYTDRPHLLRRSQRMDLPAEMQWGLLPPLGFTVDGATLSGLVEPAYEVGGDAFDYAYNAGVLDLALFDAIGHGLHSASLAGLVVGAYRHARRRGQDLTEIAQAIDAATRAFPIDPAFATAVLARLHVGSGRLTWTSCGHPDPIIVRQHGCLPGHDELRHGLPLGLGGLGPVTGDVVATQLEPGDGVLLYSDGVVEARDTARNPFGEERLRDLLAREHQANTHPQQVVRRLTKAALTHSDDRLSDDATMLYLRWAPPDDGRDQSG